MPSTANRPGRRALFDAAVDALEPRRLLSGVVYPAGAGVIDIASYPGIDLADNGHDDTAGINAALAAVGNNTSRILYFRDGVYNLGGSVLPSIAGFNMVKRTTFQGQSRDATIFRLRDATFTNPAAPRIVLDVWRGNAVAQAFANNVRNITIDIGRGNAGAIGLKFNSNNNGAIRNVRIVSGDGSGLRGLDLAIAENGPLLVDRLVVEGFDTGIHASDHINSQTLQHITLRGQRVVGIQNGSGSGGRQALVIHDLVTDGEATAYHARFEDPDPASVLIDVHATGRGAAAGRIAVTTGGSAYARGLTVTGYALSHEMKWDNRTVSGGVGVDLEASARGFDQSTGFESLFATAETGLDLPIQPTPSAPWGDVGVDWIAPANAAGDDTASIQSAIDNPGARTVYLPWGAWTVNGTLVLRGNVERLIATGTRIGGSGTIRLDDGAAPVVELIGSEVHNLLHNASRTLVVHDSQLRYYTNTPAGSGALFMENVVARQARIANQHAWLKQMNMEAWEFDPAGIGAYLRNDGGVVSILGLKTENRAAQALTFVRTVNGGSTELLGGLNYFNAGAWASDMPAYAVVDASFGMARLKSYDPAAPNSPAILVQHTDDGVTRTTPGLRRSYFIAREPDTTPPLATSMAIEFETRQAVTVAFSEPLRPDSVAADDLLATRAGGGAAAARSVSLAPDARSATWVFSAAGAWLEDGDYVFALPAGSVADAAGNALAQARTVGAFFLAGDANRDRRVDVSDLGALASHWQSAGRTFSQGDFTYDGVVDVNDLGLLATSWQAALDPSAAGGEGRGAATGTKPSWRAAPRRPGRVWDALERALTYR